MAKRYGTVSERGRSMDRRIGFIGMGNMAKAIAGGIIGSGAVERVQVSAYDPLQDKLQESASQLGFRPCAEPAQLASQSDILVMACKPYQIEGALKELRDLLPGKALLSIAAGWDFHRYQPLLEPGVRFQAIMPNTPAMVGEGVFLFEEENSLEEEERREIMNLFSCIGFVRELPGKLMGVAGAVTGCGPAFADLFIEAMADAAVKYGLPRALSYELASRMLLGAAKLQLETGEHPAALKDAVCSPGGTTIRGIAALEHAGFRAACMDAVDAVMGG